MFPGKSRRYSATHALLRKEAEMPHKTCLPAREDVLVDLVAVWQTKRPNASPVSGTAIDSPELLANRESFPRNPWRHTFGAGERGKRLFYSLRYLTKEGIGPWPDVRKIVVP
jgi:hypothetical protein